MPEATVPAAYVRARWAYSELLSGRPFRGTGVQELKRKALEHVPFDDLSGDERDQLEQAWYRVRGVPTFTNALAGIATFELVHWSKEQLEAVRRRLYRQVPLASHLWARRRHYWDRRTRHAKRFALARDRGAARCDLPIRAPLPGGMEPLPADADKNHFVREPAARNSHSGRTHQSRRHFRSRQFAHRGFERCKRTDGGTARAFFQAASAAHAARRAADYCRANNFPAQVSWLLGRSARWRSIRDQRSCHLPTTFEKTSCYPWRLSACLYPYISRRKYWGSLASGSHRGEQSRRC